MFDSLSKIPKNFIEFNIKSPPLGKLKKYNNYVFDFENIAKELYRVTKTGGVVVWIVGDATINGSETGTSFKQALFFKECGFNLHDTMIYQKNNCPFPSKNRYYQNFEYMFILTKGNLKTFNPIKDRLNKSYGRKISGTNRQKDGTTKCIKNKGANIFKYGVRFNIWSILDGKRQNEHPAVFPEQIANDHILSWSKEGDLVYDPFMGSGTTAKMAILNKRQWIGSEISEEYCKIIERRINFD